MKIAALGRFLGSPGSTRSFCPQAIMLKVRGYSVIGLLCSLATFQAWSADCVPPIAGSVGWWPAEGNANDITGTNNGTLQNGVTFAPGEVGQAFNFHSAGASVRIPASTSLNVGAGNGLTIECWINPADVSPWHPILEWNSGSVGVDLGIATSSSGQVHINVKGTDFVDRLLASPGGLLATNVFQHVAATYDKATGVAVLYLNGSVVAQQNLGVFTPMTTGDVYVGLRPFDGGAGTRFSGLIDEVSIYSRALSAAEISAIYNADSAGKCGWPPRITTPPPGQGVPAGDDVVFSVVAAGSPPFSYQWQLNGTDISGATGAVLTLTNVQPSQAGSYTVQVTNLYGSVTSSNAVLVVFPAPPPTLTNGLVAYYPFNGNAQDASRNGKNGVVHGATSRPDRFGIPNTAYSFNGTSAYIETTNALPDMPSASASCWISVSLLPFPALGSFIFMDGDNSAGRDFCLSAGSGALWITTKDNIAAAANVPPVTNTWFQLVAVADNTSATKVLKIWLNGQLMSTTASFGNANVGYHSLLCIGCRAVTHDYFFHGAIDDLRLYNRALSDAEVQQLYQYESTSPFYPYFAQQPQSLIVTNGNAASFAVVAAGGTPLSYQWQKDGVNLSDGGYIYGSATNTLVLSTTALNDAGDYRVIITNNYGSVTSSVATLTVLAAPTITAQPQSRTVTAGSSAFFGVNVSAFPPVSYQWAFNGTNILGATGAGLLLTNVQFSQSGDYTVAVTNSLGYAISTSAVLTVLAPPQIVFQPASQVAYWGLSASFSVRAIGTLPFSYQWYYYGFPIDWGTNATLELNDLDLDAGGEYSVEVSNPYGSVTSAAALLTVNPASVSPGLYFGLTITGAVGKRFGIQYVTNVTATNSWIPLTNITLTDPAQLWIDTSVNVSAPGEPRRFYRAVAIP
jgi:hypothetical protein